MKIKETECEENFIKNGSTVTQLPTLVVAAPTTARTATTTITTVTALTAPNTLELPVVKSPDEKSATNRQNLPVNNINCNNSNNNNHIEENKVLENITNIPQEVLQLNNNVNGLSTTTVATTFTTNRTTLSVPTATPTPTTTATPTPATGTATTISTSSTPSSASAIKANKLSFTSLSSAGAGAGAASSAAAEPKEKAPPTTNHKKSSSSKEFRTKPSEKSTKTAMAAATASNAPNHITNSDNVTKNDIGVLDFTINNSSSQSASVSSPNHTSINKNHNNNNNSNINNNNNNNNSNINNNNIKVSKLNNCFSSSCNSEAASRTTNSSSSTASLHNGSGNNAYGGRLQFFKDGKFILELARSKEGEKGGWVSVPRKLFRTPAAATLATVMPTSATLATYAKNENSTSLSFSDDNSSIQSSPWQRDHSWKQVTPKKNISKEMSLFFHHPKTILLTSVGTKMSKKKRRNPYDKSLPNEKFFQLSVREEKFIDKSIKKEKEEETSKESITNTNDSKAEEKSPKENEDHEMKKLKDEEDGPKDETGSGVETDIKTHNDTDVTMKSDELVPNNHLPNGNIKDEPDPKDKDDDKEEKDENATAKNKIHSIEKPTKKLKTRAKLSLVVQKLIDNMPAKVAAQMSKTSVTNGTANPSNCQPANSLSHTKVSPPSSASRLVEYHQQHVSPRKRILREFEKVSLEDNPAGAGGKRSRAKSSLNSAPTTTQFQNCRSPTNRNSLPSTSASIGSASTTNGPTSKVKNNHNTIGSSSSSGNSSTGQPTRLNSSYSIHSLLSNTTSSSSSSSNNNSSPSLSKKSNEQQQQQQQHLFNSGSHHNSIHYSDPKSYQNAALISPKSPESSNHHNQYNMGGKSPSQSSFKRRSPPYASPLHENHSRSPIVSHNNHTNDYSRSHSPRSSPAHLHTPVNRKMLYANDPASSGLSNSHSHSHSPSSHHLLQPQSNQNFYSPYMLSSPTSANTSSISPPNGNLGLPRSPRHSSAFAPTSANSNIPNSSSNAAMSSSNRDISPPRPAHDMSREASTPRTVPKKTASIRRQFASPTASNTSSCPSPIERTIEENTTTPNANYHDRKTPVSSIQNQHLLQRSSPNAAAMGGPHSNAMMSSPHGYYMYPHGNALNGAAAAASAMHHMVNANTSAAAVAAAQAAYNIPPMLPPSNYYNPYLMTFAALRQNPIWLHQYQTAAGVPMSAAAASRLASPFHNFPYNGVSHAAVAAAAAAGLSLSPHSSVPLSHLQQAAQHQQQQQQQQQQHLLSPAGYQNSNSSANATRLSNNEHASASKSTESLDIASTKPNSHQATSGLRHQQQQSQHQHQQHHHQPQSQPHVQTTGPGPAPPVSSAPSNLSSSSSRYPVDTHSIKEHEQSSDVPLNLSKH